MTAFGRVLADLSGFFPMRTLVTSLSCVTSSFLPSSMPFWISAPITEGEVCCCTSFTACATSLLALLLLDWPQAASGNNSIRAMVRPAIALVFIVCPPGECGWISAVVADAMEPDGAGDQCHAS